MDSYISFQTEDSSTSCEGTSTRVSTPPSSSSQHHDNPIAEGSIRLDPSVVNGTDGGSEDASAAAAGDSTPLNSDVDMSDDEDAKFSRDSVMVAEVKVSIRIDLVALNLSLENF